MGIVKMKYNILPTPLHEKLMVEYQLPSFCAKVLASYSLKQINDVLAYQEQPVIFDTMNEVIVKIREHLNQKNKIVILGDYDCDGVMATSIMVSTFLKLDYQVGYYIPNRIKDGYGLNEELVQQFIDKDYKLIITVDNGINAQQAIEKALKNGVDVIITDHHQREDEKVVTDALYLYPGDSNLEYFVSGGYVAYQLASKLLEYEDDYLQALAAISLISDVMPLIKGNRKFIRTALKNINEKKYPQIVSLADSFIDSNTIANLIAPKINSLGRLPDLFNPNNLVKYFCNSNKMEIINFAQVINECNNIRKQMSNDYLNNFEEVIVDNNLLMVIDHQIHEGLLGLLASRFTNTYNCVSFVACHEGDIAKASIRSIAQIDIYQILMKRVELFDKIGGHSQAVGLSFNMSNLKKIEAFLEEELKNYQVEKPIYQVIQLQASDLNIDNIKSLRYLQPFGNQFENRLFLLKDVHVADIKKLKGDHYRVSIFLQGELFEVMFFNQKNLDIKMNDSLDIVVNLSINEFRNVEKINIIMEDYQIN